MNNLLDVVIVWVNNLIADILDGTLRQRCRRKIWLYLGAVEGFIFILLLLRYAATYSGNMRIILIIVLLFLGALVAAISLPAIVPINLFSRARWHSSLPYGHGSSTAETSPITHKVNLWVHLRTFGWIFAVGATIAVIPSYNFYYYAVGILAATAVGYLQFAFNLHGAPSKAMTWFQFGLFSMAILFQIPGIISNNFDGLKSAMPNTGNALLGKADPSNAGGFDHELAGLVQFLTFRNFLLVIAVIVALILIPRILRGAGDGLGFLSQPWVKWILIAAVAIIAINILGSALAARPATTATPTPSAMFDGPITEAVVTATPDGTYRFTVSSKTFGWTHAQVPVGNYQVTPGNLPYTWDPSVSEPTVGPNGASWTPSSVSNPEQFPLPEAPIAGFIGKIGGNITYLGTQNQISLSDTNGALFGINERWLPTSFSDNNGDIPVTLTPVK